MGMQRLGRRLLFALSLLLAGSAAHAQLAEFSPENPDDFYERLDEHGRVSGDIFMGVMIGPAQRGMGEDLNLADSAPERSADVEVRRLPVGDAGPDYCVRINSKDGRLEAVNTYLAEQPAGVFLYLGTLGDKVGDTRAVSLVRVGRCGDRSDKVVPSVWKGAAGDIGDEALHVFANTAGNPAVLLVGGEEDSVPCENVTDSTTLKYTAACIVGFDLIARHRAEDSVDLTLLVARSLGEDSHKITVVLPDEGG